MSTTLSCFKLNIITVSITCFLIPYLEVSTAGVHLAIEAGMSNCQEEGLERLELPGWEECLRGVDDDKERGLSLSFSCFPTGSYLLEGPELHLAVGLPW